jgi:hypothetical protein
MAKSQSESSEDFEYIETPAAPTPTPPAVDCGVRTTQARQLTRWLSITLSSANIVIQVPIYQKCTSPC